MLNQFFMGHLEQKKCSLHFSKYSFQVLFSIEDSQNVNDVRTCNHSCLEQNLNLQPQTTNMLHQPYCNTGRKKKKEVAEEVAAYITNLIKISLPDGKGLVGM
jgi:hypothetical protein